jgi:hypothetical protein
MIPWFEGLVEVSVQRTKVTGAAIESTSELRFQGQSQQAEYIDASVYEINTKLM